METASERMWRKNAVKQSPELAQVGAHGALGLVARQLVELV